MRSRAHVRRQIKDSGGETALFRRRALAGFVIILLCLSVLFGRFAYLQVFRHEEFESRSDANRIKLRPLPPSRGLIYDRNGKLLAENVPQYRLEVVPEQAGKLADVVARLRQVVPISDEDIERFEETRKLKRRFDGVPIRFQLTESELAHFAVHRHQFPGVEVVPYLTRSYPLGPALAHVIGYVGRIDEGDRERLDASRYAGTSHIGKTGIERFYEDELLGVAGYEQVETDAQGRALRVLHRVPPTQGKHLHLSLDADLQQATIEAFEGRPGAAVAIDPRNGDVLALVSQPGFDPNLFVNGISRKDYAALLAAPYRPLFNRFLHGGYEPGSTIKPFIGLAGVELGYRTPDETILSTGAFRLENSSHAFHDWKKGGHGRVDLRESIAQSVNTYFYRLAFDMGIDRVAQYMSQFGFGAPTGIDLIGEGRGILPSRAWKRKAHGKVWFPGETVIAGIGQGYWVVTPLQLASALATLAADGVRHPPRLRYATQSGRDTAVQHARVEATPSFVKRPENLAAVKEGMVRVMHGPTGTARVLGVGSPYLIAGKSGTAQKAGRREGEGEYDENRVPERLRHNALFVAFAPAQAPRIAVAVVIEHGSAGSKAAGPVAKKIVDAYLKPETWVETQAAAIAEQEGLSTVERRTSAMVESGGRP